MTEQKYHQAVEWVRKHSAEYAGQYAALDGDQVLAIGPDAKAVYAKALARMETGIAPFIIYLKVESLPVADCWGEP